MKCYRVEFVYEGRRTVHGYFAKSLEEIIEALMGDVKGHPTVNIYHKSGKVRIASFEG